MEDTKVVYFCRQCGHRGKAGLKWFGNQMYCPACGNAIEVPYPTVEPRIFEARSVTGDSSESVAQESHREIDRTPDDAEEFYLLANEADEQADIAFIDFEDASAFSLRENARNYRRQARDSFDLTECSTEIYSAIDRLSAEADQLFVDAEYEKEITLRNEIRKLRKASREERLKFGLISKSAAFLFEKAATLELEIYELIHEFDCDQVKNKRKECHRDLLP